MTHWLTQTSAGFVFALVTGIYLLLVLYLTPAILSYSLGSEHTKWILILNLTLWWTVLGWLAALIWAAMSGNDESIDDPLWDSLHQQNAKKSIQRCEYDVMTPLNHQITTNQNRKSLYDQ